jgi:molybdopterin converting factor small subunit
MENLEKIDTLTSSFEKLEESQKDYIQELTQKLAEIHRGGEFLRESKVINVHNCSVRGHCT